MKIRKYIKTASTALLTVILLAAVALNVYVMACGAKGKAAVIGGSCVMRVSTGSMEPSIHVGDFIKTKEVPPEELEVGDVISFYSEDGAIYGKINTHRIVSRVEGGFVTRGDANPVDDSKIVHYDRVIGKYTGKMGYFRWLGSFASAKKLILLAVILLTLGISIYEVVTISKIKVEIDAEKDEQAAQEREKLIREAIEAEKQRLREENSEPKEDAPEAVENEPESIEEEHEAVEEEPEPPKPKPSPAKKPVRSYPKKKGSGKKKNKRKR